MSARKIIVESKATFEVTILDDANWTVPDVLAMFDRKSSYDPTTGDYTETRRNAPIVHYSNLGGSFQVVTLTTEVKAKEAR